MCRDFRFLTLSMLWLDVNITSQSHWDALGYTKTFSIRVIIRDQIYIGDMSIEKRVIQYHSPQSSEVIETYIIVYGC